jgi:hypothetical protein
MQAEPVFPRTASDAGMYESFYLRAVSPREPLGIWLRHTVHKRRSQAPTGSVWCTVFDPARGVPLMYKETFAQPTVPAGGWIDIGSRASMGPGGAQGGCGPARWTIRFEPLAGELRHLRPALLYRAPLPRTKLTSPAPLARFDGVLEFGADAPRPQIDLSGWHGMIGHNWGSEHAARWIWLHGCDFAGAPDAWLDVAVGRVHIGSRLTPWIANGALSFDGAIHRLTGRPVVREDPSCAELELGGRGGVAARVSVAAPRESIAGWRYADPGGSEHDVANCSVAALEVGLERRGGGGRHVLRSAYGGAYELGMQEHDHGVALAPFTDG